AAKTAHRVATQRMLDFYDVSAPVCEDRACGWHEGVLRHFQNPYAPHDLSHFLTPVFRYLLNGCGYHRRSMMIAGAMPPAAHMVTKPRFRSRRSSSSSTVPIRTAPVAPMGWPSAIAPPLTLILLRSIRRSRMNFSTTTAKASLTSKRSMSFIVRPAL